MIRGLENTFKLGVEVRYYYFTAEKYYNVLEKYKIELKKHRFFNFNLLLVHKYLILPFSHT